MQDKRQRTKRIQAVKIAHQTPILNVPGKNTLPTSESLSQTMSGSETGSLPSLEEQIASLRNMQQSQNFANQIAAEAALFQRQDQTASLPIQPPLRSSNQPHARTHGSTATSSEDVASDEAVLAAAIARAQALQQDPLEEAPHEYHKLREELTVSILSTTAPVYALAKGARREVFARDLEIVIKHARSLSTSLAVLAWKYKWVYRWLSKVSGITAITALMGELYAMGDEIAANHGAQPGAVSRDNAA